MSFTRADDLFGAWRLHSAVDVFDDGERRDEFGSSPEGYLCYHPVGIVSATLGDSARPPVRPVTLKAAPATTTKNGQALHRLRRAVQCRCRQRHRHPSHRRLAVPELARPRPSPAGHHRGRTAEHHRFRPNLVGRPDLPQRTDLAEGLTGRQQLRGNPQRLGAPPGRWGEQRGGHAVRVRGVRRRPGKRRPTGGSRRPWTPRSAAGWWRRLRSSTAATGSSSRLGGQGAGAMWRRRRMGIASSSAWPRRPGRQLRNSTAPVLLPPEPKCSAASGRTRDGSSRGSANGAGDGQDQHEGAGRLGGDRPGQVALKLVAVRNTTVLLLAVRCPDGGLMRVAFMITTPPVAG